MKVYLYQQDGRSKFYGSISALCIDNELSKNTIYKHDFKNKYDGKNFTIEMGTILTMGDVIKLHEPEVKQVKKFPLPDILPEPTKQTNLKINIQDGTYIKKDQYYFNVDGEILDEKQFLSRYGKKYNLPKKTFGDIETLLC